MKKDIFIDNNVAKNFASPVDKNYIELINWLVKYDIESDDNAHLVVSNKLLNEYFKSSRDCSKSSSIPVIIGKLTREGRLIKFKNNEISTFQDTFFTKAVLKRLLSNIEDHFHIATVLMSERKYAITIDDNLFNDLTSFNATVVKRPEQLAYK